MDTPIPDSVTQLQDQLRRVAEQLQNIDLSAVNQSRLADQIAALQATAQVQQSQQTADLAGRYAGQQILGQNIGNWNATNQLYLGAVKLAKDMGVLDMVRNNIAPFPVSNTSMLFQPPDSNAAISSNDQNSQNGSVLKTATITAVTVLALLASAATGYYGSQAFINDSVDNTQPVHDSDLPKPSLDVEIR